MSIFFISGHPKQNDQLFSEYLVVTNQYSPFCEINNYIIYENDLLKFLFKSGNINNLKSDCDEKKLGTNKNRASYDNSYAVDCGSKKRNFKQPW